MGAKTDIEWTQNIIKIITEIRFKYPELIKYIDEMPVNLNGTNAYSESPNTLREYYESLVAIVKKYKLSHDPKTHSLFTIIIE